MSAHEQYHHTQSGEMQSIERIVLKPTEFLSEKEVEQWHNIEHKA